MDHDDFVLAISPEGSRIDIFEGLYGRGQHAPIPGDSLTLGLSLRLLEAWRRALLEASTRDSAPRALSLVPEDMLPPSSAFDTESEGQRLFDLLFPEPLRKNFRLSVEAARRSERPLRVCLVLRSDPGFEHLHAIPWELLCDRELGDALARHLQTPFVRAPVVPRSEEWTPPDPPLRVLLVFPQPADRGSLDVREEGQRIGRQLREASVPIRVASVSAPVTLEAMHEQLLDHRPHVVHFGGHGALDAAGGGRLCFETPQGFTRRVSGKVFGEALKDCPDLRLVVLNACHSASTAPENAGWSLGPSMAVAGAVLAAGRCAVLAMQASIRDDAALAFSDVFYDRLAGGEALDVAANTARNRLYLANPENPEWATPVVYLRSDDARILPPAGEPMRSPSPLRRWLHDASRLIRAKTREFVGRGFVFEAIDRFLVESDGGCFFVEGDPGIGKTSLLAEWVRRHRSLHHFIERASASAGRTEHVLKNLATQAILRFGLPYETLPPNAGRSSSFLVRVLEEALAGPAAPERIVLVIDALDELDEFACSSSRSGNPLDFPRHLPPRVYCILSARRDRHVHLRFDGHFVRREISSNSPENAQDIATYVRRMLSRPGITEYRNERGLPADDFVELMAVQSEGNFMYIHYVMEEIEHGIYRHQGTDALPRGLENFYRDHWIRLKERHGEERWFEHDLPVLAAVTMVKQPVSVDFIGGVLDRQDHGRIAATLAEWSQFLHVTPMPDDPERKLFRLYHGSFHDFVRRQDEVTEERVHLRDTSRKIIDYVRREYSALE